MSPMHLKLNMPGLNSFLLLHHLLPLVFLFQLMEQSQDKNFEITIDFSFSVMAKWSPRLAILSFRYLKSIFSFLFLPLLYIMKPF